MAAATDIKLHSFEDFTKVANRFYMTIGVEPYRSSENNKKPWLFDLIFYSGFIGLNVIVLAELIYLSHTFGKFTSFLEATSACAAIGFCFVSDFKMLAVRYNKDILSNLMQTMEKHFPKTLKEQEEFCVPKTVKNLSRIMASFAGLYMTLIWVFNLIPLGQSGIEYFFITGKFEKQLPYNTWAPFDQFSAVNYPWMYLLHNYAGYVAMCGTLSADLLLCSIVCQICMHFNYISKKLREYVPKGSHNDHQVLSGLIRHHQLMLDISDDINVIFSVSILFNFLASSIIICLSCFLLTSGSSPVILFKYLLLFVSALFQVLLICYFGDTLIESSIDIGDAAYEQIWQDANVKYWKCLILIIERSQKPSFLKAATFPPISLRTFSKVMTMSYQFYAVLRTSYSGGQN